MKQYKDPDKTVDILVEGYEAFDLSFLDAQDIEIIEYEDSGSVKVRHQGKVLEVKVISKDYQHGTYVLRVNGRNFTCKVETHLHLLIKELGFNAISKFKEKEIYAPMPGMVIDVQVKEGETVVEGQVMLTLEAMKMENVIKAPRNGIIDKVSVQKGDKVEKSQLLISIE